MSIDALAGPVADLHLVCRRRPGRGSTPRPPSSTESPAASSICSTSSSRMWPGEWRPGCDRGSPPPTGRGSARRASTRRAPRSVRPLRGRPACRAGATRCSWGARSVRRHRRRRPGPLARHCEDRERSLDRLHRGHLLRLLGVASTNRNGDARRNVVSEWWRCSAWWTTSLPTRCRRSACWAATDDVEPSVIVINVAEAAGRRRAPTMGCVTCPAVCGTPAGLILAPGSTQLCDTVRVARAIPASAMSVVERTAVDGSIPKVSSRSKSTCRGSAWPTGSTSIRLTGLTLQE